MKISNLLNGPGDHTKDFSDEFSFDILTGLSSKPKRISAKYFYDDRGSELFQAISRQADYYLTKKEFAILEQMAGELPNIIREKEIDIIELGVGDGHKSKLLIDGFLGQKCKVNYYPIDISEKALQLLRQNISSGERLNVQGLVADYFTGLSHVRSLSRNRQLVLFLGSNIGNFDHNYSLEFLRRLWRSLNCDDFVLIGFDQKKSVDVLNRAYNDSAGHTAQFNLNLLTRINRELGGDFNPEKFQHYGFYNPTRGAMESHLISRVEQDVHVAELERSFHFERFEPIHLEYSYKFLPSDIEFLGRQTGFSHVRHFSDDLKYFTDTLWQVLKDPH